MASVKKNKIKTKGTSNDEQEMRHSQGHLESQSSFVMLLNIQIETQNPYPNDIIDKLYL